MRTLKELRSAVSTRGSMRRSVSAAQILDLIAHVQHQAEQLATLTARVAALEASEAERAIDRMVARRTGPGRPMVSAGKVQTPAKLDEAPLGVGAKVLVPGEVVRVDDGDCTSLVRLRSIGDQHVLWFLRQDLRPEPANTSLTCVLCRSVEPQEGRVHTIRRHGKGHTSCDCAPAAPPPPAEAESCQECRSIGILHVRTGDRTKTCPTYLAQRDAPAPASDDYEARARRYLATLLRTVDDEPRRPLAGLTTLLRTVADEAAERVLAAYTVVREERDAAVRREERAACEAVCREVAGGWAGAPRVAAIECIDRIAARECADRIAARGKDAASRACATGGGT